MTAAITSALNIGHIDKHVDCEFCQILRTPFYRTRLGNCLPRGVL